MDILDSPELIYPLLCRDELHNVIPLANLVHLHHLELLVDNVTDPHALLILGDALPGSWDASHFSLDWRRGVVHVEDDGDLGELLLALPYHTTYLFKLHQMLAFQQVIRVFQLQQACVLKYLTVTPDRFQPRIHQRVQPLDPCDPQVIRALAQSGRTTEDLERHSYAQGFGIWGSGLLIASAFALAKTPHVCEICGVYTHPAFRNKGLGSAVVSQATCHIFERGWIPCYGTREWNLPSLRLAKALGFWVYQEVGYYLGRRREGNDLP